VSDIVATRIRELRKSRGLKPADLAARCKAAGAELLTENVIENIESGRRRDGERTRDITIDELLILAYALDVAPVHLMAGLNEAERLPVTPSLTVGSDKARGWIRGFRALPGTDLRQYRANVPVSEARASWQVIRDDETVPERKERLIGHLVDLVNFERNRDQNPGL
jgi:transcriptional regulator with XRE-family HTH domain